MEQKDPGAETKSALSSKTVHFNLASGIIIPAIWPLLPKSFTQNEYALPAVTAWLTIGNIVLRRLTNEAIRFWGKHEVSERMD